MKVEFDVQLKPDDLYRFNMRQTYTSMQGPISIIIAILFIVSAVVTARNGNYPYVALYVAVAILFLVYIPITLKGRAKRTFKKNETLSKEFHYSISEENITVSAGDQTDELAWEQVYKMVSTKKQVLIFTNRLVAFIIPREQLGDKYEPLKEIGKAKLEKFRFKMK